MAFTPNPDEEDGHQEAAAPIQRFAAAVAEISKSHIGRPQPEILSALLAAAQGAGLEPNDSDLGRLAEHLSEGYAGSGG
jgi:hypothetical protein